VHIPFIQISSNLQLWLLSFLCWSLASNPTLAEIVPDTTLPTNSTVTPSGNTRVIEGGTRKGDNLLHSFREFSFSILTSDTTGDTALFNNDLAVKNIITRVTGGSPSNIDGMIQARGSANLFFINPRGIIFGHNASLDIGGSFVATTANSMKFADGTEFSANGNVPLLTVSVPIGLQFGNNPGEIIQSNPIDLPLEMQVPSGKTLALVGGNISLKSSTLTAFGGRIELGSVTGGGFVNLTEVDRGYALGYAGVQQFGDIQISGGTIIDASNFMPIKNGGGAIQIQGKNVTVSDGSLIFSTTYSPIKGENLVINATESVKLSDRSNIATITQGEGQAGDVLVKAGDSIELLETSFIGSQVCSLLINCESVTGKGGDLTFETKRLLLQDGAGIEASTFGVGHGGNILVKATDSIDLIGETPGGDIPSGIFAQVAQEAVENSGDTGNITLETKRLTVRGGAQISTTGRYGGNGGNLTINASDAIHLSGASQFATAELTDIYRSGIFVSAQPGATGKVGTFNINTGLLTVDNGARITADNFGSGEAGIQKLNVRQLVIRDGGEVRSGSFGEGTGGTLQINATDSVEVIGTGKIDGTNIPSLLSSRTEGIGKAGDLIINSDVYDGLRLRLLVQDGAQVTVSSQGSGQAGNLEITARSVKLDNQGKLIAQTASADGGNITLNLQELLLLRRNSQIFTSAGGNGGKITINSPFIVAVPQENSDITANVFRGQVGSVKINATGIFQLVARSREELQQLLGTNDPTQLDPSRLPTNDIAIDPSINGIVTINTPDVDSSRELVQLPNAVYNFLSNLTPNPFPGREGEQESKPLSLWGRGLERGFKNKLHMALPSNPVDASRQIDLSCNMQASLTKGANIPNNQIVEAQGWIIDPKGDIVLVAQAPTVNPLLRCP
jgi:filamentous hemagglutinin family protein